MSNSKQSTTRRAKALQQFFKELPDAKTCSQSTIKKEFLIGNESVSFLAQKAKGSSGMTWRVS
jgi:hypothetical protein